MFSKTLASPDLVLSMGQCLSQLASLSGPVFSSDQEKISYVINYVRGMLTAINERLTVIKVACTTVIVFTLNFQFSMHAE